MLSTPKPTLIATIMFLCVCCAQFAKAQRQTTGKEAQRQTTGKLELKPIVVPEYKMVIYVLRDPWKCCPDKSCCLSNIPILRIKQETKCKSVGDLGILVNFSKDSTAVVEEVSLEIYSAKNELVFSTKTQGLSLRATDNPTGYLLALGRAAASIAQRHFIEENKIFVTFKASGDKGVPDRVYLVNVNEGKPVK